MSDSDHILTVRAGRCPRNHICVCVKACPAGALTQEGRNAPAVDNEKCIKCGKCVKMCRKAVFIIEERQNR